MTKIEYAKAYADFCRMPIPKLQEEMRVMHNQRYVLYDLEAGELYKIAARAYNIKTRKGTGLIFHMKNLVPMLITCIIVSMFK